LSGVDYMMDGAAGEEVKELQRYLTTTGLYRYKSNEHKDGITGQDLSPDMITSYCPSST
jgi:hypothetical protein